MDNTQKELIELEKNLSYQEGFRDGIVRAIEIGKQVEEEISTIRIKTEKSEE